jgi:hypothetical protein
MRETSYRVKMADVHSKMAARSGGKRAEFHAAMEATWKQAAYTPRRSVEPDPPEPG